MRIDEVPAVEDSPRLEGLRPDEVRRVLVGAGKTLSARLRRSIAASGAAAVPSLIAVLTDEALQMEDAPGLGYAPVHAAEILGEIASPDAVEPMLAVLADAVWLTLLHDALLRSLPPLGAAVVEPALRLYAAHEDKETRESLVAVLSGLAVRDSRIFNLLIEALLKDPDRAAGLLAEYGDPAALPFLSDAFDRQRVKGEGGMLANQVLVELHAAIRELGGSMSVAQEEKFARAMEVRTQAFAEMRERAVEGRTPVRTTAKPGRNESCWCGSGKKYKKCHLVSDEEDGPGA
jgi:hypothetical protein